MFSISIEIYVALQVFGLFSCIIAVLIKHKTFNKPHTTLLIDTILDHLVFLKAGLLVRGKLSERTHRVFEYPVTLLHDPRCVSVDSINK